MKPSNFSWVVKDRIAASSYPYTENNIAYFKAQGIKVIINLSEQITYDDPDLIIYHKSIPDFSIPSKETVMEILAIIDKHLSNNEPVVIHCIAGCGRTGTILSLWLAYNENDPDPQVIIQKLRKSRPCSVETQEQEEFVVTFTNKYLS